MRENAPSAPKLSDDLRRFAAEIDLIRPEDYAGKPEGIAAFITAMGGVMRMFALDAEGLEHRLETAERMRLAAECRAEALATTDHVGELARKVAIEEGKRAGVIVDLRRVFDDEQAFNLAQREETNDGDAA